MRSFYRNMAQTKIEWITMDENHLFLSELLELNRLSKKIHATRQRSQHTSPLVSDLSSIGVELILCKENIHKLRRNTSNFSNANSRNESLARTSTDAQYSLHLSFLPIIRCQIHFVHVRMRYDMQWNNLLQYNNRSVLVEFIVSGISIKYYFFVRVFRTQTTL